MIRILCVLAALIAADPAHAQDPTFSPDIQAILDHAAASGLPVEPLERKAVEGLAKGVPEARIVSTLGELERDFVAARAVSSTADTALSCAIAGALRAGLTSEAARSVLQSTPEPLQEAAMWTLADLLGAGLREASALRLVRSAVAAGKPEYGLRGLATATVALLASGVSEQATVARLTDAVDQGRSPLTAIPSPPSSANGNGPQNGGHDNGNGNSNGNANGNADKQRAPRNGS